MNIKNILIKTKKIVTNEAFLILAFMLILCAVLFIRTHYRYEEAFKGTKLQVQRVVVP